SFVLTVLLFLDFKDTQIALVQHLFTWVSLDNFNVNFAFLADQLSIFMALFVTFVGWLIHIYAVGYMDKDEGFGKFFSYFNLFLGFMLLLVLADNPVILFIGWEGVGLCSYLLIGFYYEDKKNVEAGNKAFFLNRIGDLGFLLGLVVLFFAANLNSFDFYSIQNAVQNADKSLLSLSALLFFVGAVGKSAQFPLYVWLPDAMRGPTPISALIHAATMVTAGVYLIARFYFLYDEFVDIGIIVAYIGAFTALFAAIIATKQNDIKKILAYSTISQLGYMFIAVGVGLYSAGLFHVFTHAFFKALLFMSAGAIIIYSHHKQDIFEIAQNRVKMPIIQFSMLMGILAICAIPPFSGFFSKDLILAGVFAKEHYALWSIAIITAFLTSFYIFRAYIIMFHSKTNKNIKTVKINPFITVPIVILAFGSIVVGFLNVPHIFGGNSLVSNWFSNIEKLDLHLLISTELMLMALSIVVSVSGAFIAYKKYISIDIYENQDSSGLIKNKFYIDEIYHFIFVKGLQRLSLFISYVLDKSIIDDFLMNRSQSYISIGKVVAKLQSGDLNIYALTMLLGINIIILYIYFFILG
ncbi:MAG: NADH-quinone oxidoreductase subunit L, partial [Campylobacterota bacterium]|nr:NADH-quinone oxidoreductase subunit L [Campylobacterota bacterium]